MIPSSRSRSRRKPFPFSPPSIFHRRRFPPRISADMLLDFAFRIFWRMITVTLFLAALLFSCFVLYRAAETAGFRMPTSYYSYYFHDPYAAAEVSPDASFLSDSEEYRLEKVLKDASMQDKTVILTTLNAAWAAHNSIIDLFLESFRIGEHTRNSDDMENKPNGGFKFVRSNNRSIEFYKYWYAAREIYPGLHDQDVLNRIKNDSVVYDIGLKIRFLSSAYFGGFCEPSEDLNEVCTMHANCCFGMDSKLHDLRILLQDWKRYMSLPPRFKFASILSWRVPQNCSLDALRHNDPEVDFGPMDNDERID